MVYFYFIYIRKQFFKIFYFTGFIRYGIRFRSIGGFKDGAWM